MGKWFAGIAASVIAGLIVWWVINTFFPGDEPPVKQPVLNVSAWYTPEPMKAGKAIDIFVKVLKKDDSPVKGAVVKLTPIAGTFNWAGSGVDPIEGRTNQHGLFSTKFQTVLQVGIIGGEPPPSNSKTGRISILVKKEGYKDGRSELRIEAVD